VRGPLPAALDVGGADHIAPTLDLGADLSTELLRRAHDRLEPERRQPFQTGSQPRVEPEARLLRNMLYDARCSASMSFRRICL